MVDGGKVGKENNRAFTGVSNPSAVELIAAGTSMVSKFLGINRCSGYGVPKATVRHGRSRKGTALAIPTGLYRGDVFGVHLPMRRGAGRPLAVRLALRVDARH